MPNREREMEKERERERGREGRGRRERERRVLPSCKPVVPEVGLVASAQGLGLSLWRQAVHPGHTGILPLCVVPERECWGGGG